MMVGLKINFNKSKIVGINDFNNVVSSYAEIFNYQIPNQIFRGSCES